MAAGPVNHPTTCWSTPFPPPTHRTPRYRPSQRPFVRGRSGWFARERPPPRRWEGVRSTAPGGFTTVTRAVPVRIHQIAASEERHRIEAAGYGTRQRTCRARWNPPRQAPPLLEAESRALYRLYS